MQPYTLTGASEAAGRSKSTVLRAIQKGRLSATRTDDGGWAIDPSELARVYPWTAPSIARSNAPGLPLSNGDATNATAALHELRIRLEAAETRIADKDAQLADAREQINDLRRRLDRADERLTALLTDQRAAPPASPRRSWWRWERQ